MTTPISIALPISRSLAAFLLSTVTVAICSGNSRAQDGAATPPPTSAPTSAGAAGEVVPDDLLRGPTVDDVAPAKTLVRHDFEGRLEPLDIRAEEAALDLLSLDETERAATEKVLSAHKVGVRALLYDNMDLFLEMQAKRQAGDREAFRESFAGFRELAAPLIDPTLLDRLAEPLSSANATELRRLVGEYRAAVAKEAAPEAADRPRRGGAPGAGENSESMDGAGAGTPRARGGARAGDRPGPGAAALAQRAEALALLREMAQTLAASVTERRARMAELISAVGATPEQAEQITAILREGAGEGAGRAKGQASPESRGVMMQKLLAVLTPEQRQLAVKHFRER